MISHGQQKGFSLVVILVAIIVIGAVGATSWLIYSHRKQSSSQASSVNQTKQPSISTKKPADPYTGWKSYCDTIYKYCLKYPADWKFDQTTVPNKPGDPIQVTIISPDGKTAVIYRNSDLHGAGALVSFTTTELVTPGTAIQDLSLIGGYYASSGVVGNFAPGYYVVDSSLLGKYPLTKGQASQFHAGPHFTTTLGNTSYSGWLTATPAISINTLDQAQAWFQQTDTKTSVLILRSLSVQ